MTDLHPEPPLAAVVQLGHAAVQRVAELSGTDLLHIKGYAIDPTLTEEGRIGTDVDVLVRPAQVRDFLHALVAAGWTRVIGFRAGSSFGHAATLHHTCWGYVDVHRMFPGIGVDPGEAFELLWSGRRTADIGGIACLVPDTVAQTVILVLNAGRTATAGAIAPDVLTSWGRADGAQRAAVEALVRRLGAQLAFAAGTGHLEEFHAQREYALWRVMSEGGTRLEEWRARIVAAPTWRDRLHLILIAPLVNVEHLAVLLGRRPTRREIALEFFRRPVRGVHEQLLAPARHRGATATVSTDVVRGATDTEGIGADLTDADGIGADRTTTTGSAQPDPPGAVPASPQREQRAAEETGSGAGGYRLPVGVGAVDVDGVIYVAPVPEGPIRILTGSAAEIWVAVFTGTPDSVVERVALTFEAEPIDIRPAVEGFVSGLLADGLVARR